MPSDFPNPPPNPIRPIDQVQMINVLQRAFIRSPSRTIGTYKPIIRTLESGDNMMGLPERGPESWCEGCTIREVSGSRDVSYMHRVRAMDNHTERLHGLAFWG
jgi:hypothetical protein